jgi:hypothetical protein
MASASAGVVGVLTEGEAPDARTIVEAALGAHAGIE